MRFLETGADIPDALIVASITGGTVFLCGAGVSKRVGFPLFQELTEDVYRRLGESPDNEPAERQALDRREFDRALRSLERRTHRPGARGARVREAVAQSLQPREGLELLDHAALLQLSCDAEGNPRLLTTNFDTNFERAAAASGIANLPSHAGKSLPRPSGPLDHGVLHLHGRIADEAMGLNESDLILTSADFGDAYLRDGWASRYMEDRRRLAILVLVGYQAEDAALRLLLETLDADRERFPDLKDIYALERTSEGSASTWKAKGIRPVEFGSYDDVYATLREWARFAARPVEYAGERIANTMAKPPAQATEFEREQLRFFLAREDLAATLAAVNPSLAWLPLLAEWRLIRFDDRALSGWIERNFADLQAVREVVAAINLFGPEAAEVLEYRLQPQAKQLTPLTVQCWRLIVRQMRSTRRGIAHSDWFDIAPRVQAGERSHEVLERLAGTLRPTLRIGKLISFRDDGTGPPERPTDLMEVEYEVEESVNTQEILAAWPEAEPAESDDRLLSYVSGVLEAALADATDVGVEDSAGYSTTDSDVPSVADHPQNTYRSGFLPIVRVAADLWTRLAGKDQDRALAHLRRWQGSPYRLNRRLALFAAADANVPVDTAAALLLVVPAGELFLTNGSVEVFRLMHARWGEFAPEQRTAIEARLCAGPPGDWFRVGAEVDKCVDRSRFDILGQLKSAGFQLGADAERVLAEIAKRWPHWQLWPVERAGFHFWHESSSGAAGDVGKLEGIPPDRLVAEAIRIDAEEDFGRGDSWRALCRAAPERALLGLVVEARREGLWRVEAWHTFLWARTEVVDAAAVDRVATILLDWPADSFAEIADAVSYWLGVALPALDEKRLWPLWDRIYAVLPADAPFNDDDPLTSALNAPAGRLAEVLLRKLRRSEGDREMDDATRERLDMLLGLAVASGRLARVRLAAEVSLLFNRAPKWTTERLVPLFDWSSDEARFMWSARKYSNSIGGEELFRLTKADFLKLFERAGATGEDLRVFAEWIAAIMIANQSGRTNYPLSATEARGVMRRHPGDMLQAVAHQLAIEMESAPLNERPARWREVVRPVFEGIWPLDIELQTEKATFKLVQIARATGAAFGEAVDVMLPFVLPEPHHTTVYSLQDANDVVYQSAPHKMLDLVAAVVGEPAGRVFGLRKVLDRVRAVNAGLADTPKFQRLLNFADR